jgi:hypothetical protein
MSNGHNIIGFIWSAAHEYPKKGKNKLKEKEGILNNTMSFNIQSTLL